MALWAIYIKREIKTSDIVGVLVVDSKYRDQEYYESKMLIELMLNDCVHIVNLDVETTATGEKKLVLKGSHINNGNNYAIASMVDANNGTYDERLCIVTNGYNGMYECLYAVPYWKQYFVERIISSVEGIEKYIGDACINSEYGKKFKFFNAAVSKDRCIGELMQLDIVADGRDDVDAFMKVPMSYKDNENNEDKNNSNKRFRIFNKKKKEIENNAIITKTQSYFDYDEPANDTVVTKTMFEIMIAQDEEMRNATNLYNVRQFPVFNTFNGKINLISIYGDGPISVNIREDIGRIELENREKCRSLKTLIVKAPNGIDIAKAPYDLRNLFIVSYVGSKIELRHIFWNTTHLTSEIRANEKYVKMNLDKIVSNLNLNSHRVNDVFIPDFEYCKSCSFEPSSNVKAHYYNGSDLEIKVTVEPGIQKIRESYYDGNAIYVIGI